MDSAKIRSGSRKGRISASALEADGLLLLTAIIWGFAFSAQRSGMEFIGPFAYSGLRFALGALSLLPLLIHSRRRTSKRTVVAAAGGTAGGTSGVSDAQLSTNASGHGTAVARSSIATMASGRKVIGIAAAGTILFAGSTLQQVGLVSTTAGNAGFITCLYVVLVPLFGVFLGRRSSPRIWIGAALALGGLYILSIGAGFTMARGDVLVFVGAFFWAFHILIVARLANRMDPLELAFGQYLLCSILSLALAVATEPNTFAGIVPAAIPILYGGILSIGVAFTLQIIAQKTAHPAHASIILSMEALFAAVGGVILLGEPVTARLVTGGACMLAGMLISQAETESGNT